MCKLALVLAATLLFVLPTPVHAFDCEGLALSDGCLFTVTGGDTTDPDDGYAVTNANDVPLWDFVRERDLQAPGYPISQRWTEGPFTLQAFQKVILQWDPGKQRVNYYNTLDALANRYPWIELPFVPPHQVLEADQGADFATIKRNHLELLDQNPTIKERFLSEPDWLNLYGLPIRYEEREVAGNPAGVQLLRSQRTVFVVWNVPAPGVTVGRVNLQNVPDKLKQLSNIVVPDAAKALARAPGPALNPAIRALPWIADGIVPHEEDDLLLLRTLSSSSPELILTLLVQRRAAWLQRPLDIEAEAALGILLAFADIPWNRKYIGPTPPDLLAMLLYTPRDRWPPSFRSLLHKSWMRDGITSDELRFTDALLNYSLGYARRGASPAQQTKVTTIVDTMLTMPFLDTFEGYESDIFRRLPEIEQTTDEQTGETRHTGGLDYTLGALSSLTLAGGITDQQALLHMFSTPSRIDTKPQEYAAALNRRHTRFRITNRDVFLPSSGLIRLFIIHNSDQHVAPNTMDNLERALHEVAEFMPVPFPHKHVVLFVGRQNNPHDQGRNNLTHITIAPPYVEYDASSSETRRILAHIISHYYWIEYSRWIYEGAAVVVEYGLGYRDIYWPPEAGHPEFQHDPLPTCEFDSISEITGPNRSACDRYLGPRLFHDLYRSLDRISFRNGFANLINLTYRRL